MSNSDNKITFSSFYNNITIHFYEDDQFMESIGRSFGLNINKDYFLAISFMYPSDMVVSYNMKNNLMQQLTDLTAYGPLNAAIPQPQMILCDKGTSMLLAAPAQRSRPANRPRCPETDPAGCNPDPYKKDF